MNVDLYLGGLRRPTVIEASREHTEVRPVVGAVPTHYHVAVYADGDRGIQLSSWRVGVDLKLGSDR